MSNPVHAILFATNLSEDCKQAFNFVVTMAARCQAKIVILHVVEKPSDYVEGRLSSLLGEEEYDHMLKSKKLGAKEILIGKRRKSKIITEALSTLCEQAKIDNETKGFNPLEIVVSEGDIVDNINKAAEKYECNIIVMGTHKGFLSHDKIGNRIKSVIRQSKRAVMIVPPVEG